MLKQGFKEKKYYKDYPKFKKNRNARKKIFLIKNLDLMTLMTCCALLETSRQYLDNSGSIKSCSIIITVEK